MIRLSVVSLTVILISLIPNTVNSQDTYRQNQLKIDAEGTVNVVADLVMFRVNITQTGANPKEAFDRHKEQESFLTNLLMEESIPDSNITANPINISDVRRGNQVMNYQTRQSVLIRLDDIDRFEAIQLTLIENGFVNFSGSFASTETESAKYEALKRAVENARGAAELLAESMGGEIRRITHINYSSRGDFRARSSEVTLSAYSMQSEGSLLQFERTIPVTERITVYFLFD